MKRPRVLLADDHQVLAEGLRSLLQAHFNVVGIVSDGREVVAAAKRLDPDVVVLDISMPFLNGIDAARQLRSCTLPGESRLPDHARRGDIRRADPGGRCLGVRPEALGGLRAGHRHPGGPQGGHVHHPSDRRRSPGLIPAGCPRRRRAAGGTHSAQREVLQLAAEGRSAKEIASILHISTRTAEFHKARLMDTLGLQNTAELVQYAIRTGICTV